MKTNQTSGGVGRAPVTPSDYAYDVLLRELSREENPVSSGTAGSTSDFDPAAIRDLLRDAEEAGMRPTRLVLGRQEAAAYRFFLWENFGEIADTNLRGYYMLGLQVAISDEPSMLALEGEKSPSSPRAFFNCAA